MTQKIRVLLGAVFLLLVSDPSHAALWPLQVGQVSEMVRTDSLNNSWNITGTVLDQEVHDGQTYFHMVVWNYNNDGQYRDSYLRSTDSAVYSWDPGGEQAVFRSGTPGETWTVGNVIYTIMDPETVTVPYGGPYTAVVNRHGRAGGPYCYNYSVPDIGMVQEIDYWTSNAPKISQLVSISAVPIPGAVWLLASGLTVLVGLRKKFKK